MSDYEAALRSCMEEASDHGHLDDPKGMLTRLDMVYRTCRNALARPGDYRGPTAISLLIRLAAVFDYAGIDDDLSFELETWEDLVDDETATDRLFERAIKCLKPLPEAHSDSDPSLVDALVAYRKPAEHTKKAGPQS